MRFSTRRSCAKRAAQRAEDSAAQRLDATLDLLDVPLAEFERLTRRALSQMGNLPKLASSPLTRLPMVSQRLAQNGQPDGTLIRASELKTVLTESITKLQPRDEGEFGTTDAWRHYNALYFPYVVGLRPYSRRAFHNEDYQDVLVWFRSQVPERTLYNWQTAAACLVARDLRERSRHLARNCWNAEAVWLCPQSGARFSRKYCISKQKNRLVICATSVEA